MSAGLSCGTCRRPGAGRSTSTPATATWTSRSTPPEVRRAFYANEIWSNGGKESFHHYKRRVGGDIKLGQRMLARDIPGWTSHGTFAVPFGNYGQHGSNDPRIEPWLSKFLKARFAAIFIQDGDGFSAPGRDSRTGSSFRVAGIRRNLEAHLLAGLAHLTTGR